jgi:hypothetical protein
VRVPERFEELDRTYLPRAAARVRAAQGRLRARQAQWRELRGEVEWTSPRALDARFGGLRPLALVKDLPQVGFIAIAVVLLVGTGTAFVRQEAPQPPPSVADIIDGAAADTGPLRLGPEEGTLATDYRAQADVSVARAVDRPGKRTALLSLEAYRTPAQLQQLMAGVQVRRVYLRAPQGGKDAGQFPVEIGNDLLADLRNGYAQVVRNRQEIRESYLGYVATTNNDKPFQQLYQSLATAAEREAKAFATDCACVFAAVIDADVTALLALRPKPGVRALEVAERTVGLRDAVILPLLPETKGRVPRAPLPGDPAH